MNMLWCSPFAPILVGITTSFVGGKESRENKPLSHTITECITVLSRKGVTAKDVAEDGMVIVRSSATACSVVFPRRV